MFDHPLEISETGGVRYLHFGSPWIQGAMRIRRPYALELAYTREMMACLLLRPDAEWPRRVLLIGLGAGSLAKFIYQHLPETRTTVVEIDARIVPIAQQYFRLPIDPQRLKIVIADAADYVEQTRNRYDAIFVDGFGANSRPGRLDTPEFYEACRNRLSPDGLMICNLLGHSRGFQASIKRIQKAFEKRAAVFPSLDSGNTILFATGEEKVNISLEKMRIKALEIKTHTGLDLKPTLDRLQNSPVLADGCLRI